MLQADEQPSAQDSDRRWQGSSQRMASASPTVPILQRPRRRPISRARTTAISASRSVCRECCRTSEPLLGYELRQLQAQDGLGDAGVGLRFFLNDLSRNALGQREIDPDLYRRIPGTRIRRSKPICARSRTNAGRSTRPRPGPMPQAEVRAVRRGEAANRRLKAHRRRVPARRAGWRSAIGLKKVDARCRAHRRVRRRSGTWRGIAGAQDSLA